MSTQTEVPRSVKSETVTDFSQDLAQLSEFATLVTSARDALSDEIVSRVASALSEGITLLDRLTRNEGLMRLLQVLDRDDCQFLLVGLADALTATSREIATAAPARGGMGEIVRLMRQPGTQEGLRVLSLLGEHISESMRELHRRGDG
ncbi:MAG: hypothetical protein GC149_00250 [Gammaproteobacteria bacterium]|nr:hypothetical protein [Gammaproteobacteria bacterium]